MNRKPSLHTHRRRAFILVEVMLAVTILAIAVIALGTCVENCLVAMKIKQTDTRARLLLSNRVSEIYAGAIEQVERKVEKFDKGAFAGMSLTTVRTPIKRKNEKEQDIIGVFLVEITAEWKEGVNTRTRTATLYHYPRQR